MYDLNYLSKIIGSTFVGIIIFAFGISNSDTFPLALTLILLIQILIYMVLVSYRRSKAINIKYWPLWTIGSILPIVNIFVIGRLSNNKC